MLSSAGILRSEALLTERAAHFVCFPGTGRADRISTVRAPEYEHGLVLLHLCRSMRPVDRSTVRADCASARAALRAGASSDDVFAQARARGLLREAEVRVASVAAPVHEEVPVHQKVPVHQACHHLHAQPFV